MISQMIISDHSNLKIVDITFIFKNALSGKYGEFYESLTIPKILSWFSDHFDERCNIAELISTQENKTFSNPLVVKWDNEVVEKLFKDVSEAVKEKNPFPTLPEILQSQDGYFKMLNESVKSLTIDQLNEIISKWEKYPSKKAYQEVLEKELKKAIEESVKKRMISDVPISLTLSGGVDSNIIAYLMGKEGKNLNAYTLGFENDQNEMAEKVAKTYGFKWNYHRIKTEEVIKTAKEVVKIMEEPSDKGSLLPTYFLSRMIKEKVTLIGEGADEIFGGYNRHVEHGKRMKNKDKNYLETFIKIFPRGEIKDYIEGYGETKNAVLLYDLEHEIPNYHTPRIDKCMMNFRIEARVPYLDPKVVDLALKIPYILKVNPEKKILRELFKGEIPDEFLSPPKSALKIPYDLWVEDPEIKEIIYSCPRILFRKYFINDLYERKGKRNRSRMLWMIFLTSLWYDHFFKNTDLHN